jgi:hypothetical protein
MALRGKKPQEITKRLKAFFYGVAGAGKTMAAIQFPCPYVIDTEKGAENAQYAKLITDNGGVTFQTSDFNEIITEVKSLLSERHPYKTLVLDSMTPIYNNILDVSAEKLSKNGKDGTEMGRHYAEANKQMKRLLMLLMRLDMNVIVTSHAKNEYGQNLSVIGTTFDCYKKLDYLFDLVIEVEKKGRSRKGVVKKTRIASFDEEASFDFSYGEIADRYGRDVMEKESVVQKMSSQEQIHQINFLIKRCPHSVVEGVNRSIEKAGATSFEDLTEEYADKLIVWLQTRIKVESVETENINNERNVA